MLDDFLIRAGLAGVGVAGATGPLGVFVVWRRMAYFGDATAHAAILGVALALAVDLPIATGTLLVAGAMALTVAGLTGRGWAADTVLGVAAHGALAVGLVAISFVQGVRLDLQSYLFGDILAVSRGDIAFVWGGALVVAGLIAWRWNRLLLSTVNTDLAQAAGIRPGREALVLTIALALVVALSLKIVGALLISALLIIPAAAARPLARSPEQMVAGATAIGAVSALGGLWASAHWDTPAGPSIVSAAVAIFALTVVAGRLRR
ncbi:metal ABC transporter permease [Falsirhodobacter halotolerans]|uniref:metal ABC transporter permease n=1 Tax=Falsirhodobacter halotolerans TaxID=1146892 RepID=UPI001FD04597|nr:metal ABC transporter permease [Falsirhodobacter halotolerans]MCJ8138696.1 metal ABC transporter permease [Falsirhodobacter halotolerans]